MTHHRHTRPGAARSDLLLLAACAAAIAVQAVSAWFVIPTPHKDAVGFVPAAIHYRATGLLANPLYAFAHETDPTGAARFLFHAPLFPWLVGSLMGEATPRDAFLAIAAIRSVGLAALAAAMFLFLRRAEGTVTLRQRAVATVLAAALLIAEAGMRLPPVGRPEALGEIFAAAAGLLSLGAAPRAAVPAMAVLLGLMGATHPAGAVLLGVLFAARLAFALPPVRAVAGIAASALGGAAVAFALIALSPNGLPDTLHGLLANAAKTYTRGTASAAEMARYLFFWPDRFFFFAFFLLVALFGVPLLWADRRRVRAPWLFWGILCLSPALVWTAGVKVPARSYNLAMLTPVLFLALVRIDLACFARGMARTGVALAALASVAAAVSAASLLKPGAELAAALAEGKTYDAARSALRHALAEAGNGCLWVDHRAWVLSEDYARMRAEDPAHCPAGGATPLLFLEVPQGACGAAPGAARATVLLDWRAEGRPNLLGMPVSRFAPGYSFCLSRIEP